MNGALWNFWSASVLMKLFMGFDPLFFKKNYLSEVYTRLSVFPLSRMCSYSCDIILIASTFLLKEHNCSETLHPSYVLLDQDTLDGSCATASFLSNFNFIAALGFVTCLQVSLKEMLSSLWIQMTSFGLHGHQLRCPVSSAHPYLTILVEAEMQNFYPQWFRSGLFPTLNWWRHCLVFSIQHRVKPFSWNSSRGWKWPSCSKPHSEMELPSGPLWRLIPRWLLSVTK